MLLLAACAALIAALCFGGSFKNIEKSTARLFVLPIAAAVIDLVSPLLVPAVLPRDPYYKIMVGIFYLLCLAFALVNLRLPLFAVPAAIGTLLNAAVILANDFYMPVAVADPAAITGRMRIMYTLLTPATKLPLLCDRIYLPFPRGFASAGDIFLAAGAAFLIFYLLRPRFFRNLKLGN